MNKSNKNAAFTTAKCRPAIAERHFAEYPDNERKRAAANA